jgi:hypothetical protein
MLGVPLAGHSAERAAWLRSVRSVNRRCAPGRVEARMKSKDLEPQAPTRRTGLPECRVSLTEPAFSLRQRFVQYVRFWWP